MPEIPDAFEEIKISKESDEELIEESDEELIQIKSPKKNENTTDWYDKNKF